MMRTETCQCSAFDLRNVQEAGFLRQRQLIGQMIEDWSKLRVLCSKYLGTRGGVGGGHGYLSSNESCQVEVACTIQVVVVVVVVTACGHVGLRAWRSNL
jgi:hypothetical protein